MDGISTRSTVRWRGYQSSDRRSPSPSASGVYPFSSPLATLTVLCPLPRHQYPLVVEKEVSCQGTFTGQPRPRTPDTRHEGETVEGCTAVSTSARSVLNSTTKTLQDVRGGNAEGRCFSPPDSRGCCRRTWREIQESCFLSSRHRYPSIACVCWDSTAAMYQVFPTVLSLGYWRRYGISESPGPSSCYLPGIFGRSLLMTESTTSWLAVITGRKAHRVKKWP